MVSFECKGKLMQKKHHMQENEKKKVSWENSPKYTKFWLHMTLCLMTKFKPAYPYIHRKHTQYGFIICEVLDKYSGCVINIQGGK